MLDVRYSARFRRDVKICQKRRCDMSILKAAVDTLCIPETLPAKNADHALTGNYSGYRECHISPDWLLVYRYEGNELFLYRTGRHSDLEPIPKLLTIN